MTDEEHGRRTALPLIASTFSHAEHCEDSPIDASPTLSPAFLISLPSLDSFSTGDAISLNITCRTDFRSGSFSTFSLHLAHFSHKTATFDRVLRPIPYNME